MKTLIYALLFFFSLTSVSAQLSEDETTDLDYILGAYQNLAALSGYQVSGTVTGTQYLVADGSGLLGVRGSLDLFLDLSYTTQVNPLAGDVSAQMQQSFRLIQDGGNPQSVRGEVSLIGLAGRKYGKFVLDVPQAAIPQDEWFDWETMQGPNDPRFPVLNTWSEPFFFRYLISTESVQSLLKLPTEEDQGQSLRVFWLTLDPEFLRQAGVISQTSIGEGSDLNMTATLTGMGDLVADSAYLVQIRVLEEFALPYDVTYIYTNDIQADGAVADQDIIGKLRYFDFGIEPQISAPLLGN